MHKSIYHTRAQKKLHFQTMASEFLRTAEVNKLTDLRNDLLEEITTCGFSMDMLEITKIIMPVWKYKLDSYIDAISRNEMDSELKNSTETSLLGLEHLVDLSALPE